MHVKVVNYYLLIQALCFRIFFILYTLRSLIFVGCSSVFIVFLSAALVCLLPSVDCLDIFIILVHLKIWPVSGQICEHLQSLVIIIFNNISVKFTHHAMTSPKLLLFLCFRFDLGPEKSLRPSSLESDVWSIHIIEYIQELRIEPFPYYFKNYVYKSYGTSERWFIIYLNISFKKEIVTFIFNIGTLGWVCK